jgi:hypothetical protein
MNGAAVAPFNDERVGPKQGGQGLPHSTGHSNCC